MILLVNRIAESWFLYMASATIQATVVALVILGMLWIGRHWSPALRYALMLVALCKFVAPPMMSLPTGLLNRIRPQRWTESAPPLRYVAPVAQNILRPVHSVHSGNMRTMSHASLPKPSLTVRGRLLLLHLSGALLILAVAAVQKIRLGRLASRATATQAPALVETYDALCRSMKLIRKPRLLICTDNQAPITFGAWKPVVMLPQALVSALPLTGIRVILGHELAHNRRRDPWMAWLQVIISSIWWFHPVYWLLSRSIRSVREDCCDDMVLASGIASREVYCRTLLKAARAALENKAVARAAFAYLGKSLPLQRRFKRIMCARFIRAPKLAFAGMLMIIALALVLLPGVEPRVLAQNAIRSGAHAWSINPAPQETAAVYNKASKAGKGSAAENRNKLYEPLSGSKQLQSELPQMPENANVLHADAQGTPKQPSQSSLENDMSDYYRKWLTEDVRFITTQEERNAFLALRDDQERDYFIEQFWARRNPNPRQANNSFKEEHYRRIGYANQHFASSVPGWRTDRGRIYIMFGKPDELESHPTGGSYTRPYNQGGGTTTTYPFEKWRYRHIDGIGDDIEIEFVDSPGTGEYRIAMSPDEKDARIKAPNAGVVPTPVNYNFLPYDIRADFVRRFADKALVLVTIELSNKDLEDTNVLDVNRAVVNAYGIVTNLAGRIMYEWEDVISVEHPDDFSQASRNRKSEYQKSIWLPPGQRYKFDLILKDANGKKAGARSLELDVPKF
jgi:GWxTD domain-containing protein